MADLPLVVFGPRSLEYDFGPSHPLSPRRFGPGIDLLRAVGAEPGLAPEPAADEELEWLHSYDYVATVRHLSDHHDEARASSRAGIGPGDDPPFAGMHEAAATVAGGSIRATEAILRGDVEHAYHPGGGLHHAMRSKASGFCIYNDVALAIYRARRDGLRVLYVDLDVHHGDGVQALHYADPGVLTISFHESGRWLFPGTGFVDELGEGAAAGTSVNVPMEPGTGPDEWLTAVRAVVPSLAASFGPDIVVSQHGADSHVWDPLAHLALTTTAMGEAARLVDAVAHRFAGGRWLATGGGGYSVYRVVPRAWALTWLAGAHREIPFGGRLPADWVERWSGIAARWEDAPLPATFEDSAETAAAWTDRLVGGGRHLVFGRPVSESPDETDEETVELVRTVTVPALLRVAEREGWWRFDGAGLRIESPGAAPPAEAPAADGGEGDGSGASREGGRGGGRGGSGEPTVRPLTRELLERSRLAAGVVSVADPAAARDVLAAALSAGCKGVAAVSGEWLVGIALAAGAASPIAGAASPAAASDADALGDRRFGFRRDSGATESIGSLGDPRDRPYGERGASV